MNKNIEFLKLTPSSAWMLKFLLGYASRVMTSVPTRVFSDNRIDFSFSLSKPLNWQAEKMKDWVVKKTLFYWLKNQRQYYKISLYFTDFGKLNLLNYGSLMLLLLESKTKLQNFVVKLNLLIKELTVIKKILSETWKFFNTMLHCISLFLAS